MAIMLRCNCGKKLRVNDEYAGRRARCPACKVLLPIPAPATRQPEARLPEWAQGATIDAPPPTKPAEAATLDGVSAAGVSTPPAGAAVTREFSNPVVSAGCTVAGDFADYEVIEEIARGGMGVVFKARQKKPRRLVALKMILAGQLATPEQVRRFRHEAEEAGRLDHPNIVPIYQVGEVNGQHYFSMKLIEGGSLAGALAERRLAADPSTVARLLGKVARAVHYAHQHGVLHRDLKPGNVLLDPDGEPHVMDFGLAKHLGEEGPGTQSGAITGTPGYMAPEQAQGHKNLTVAADIHGLGAILYELLAGRPPFEGGSVMAVLHKVIERDPTPLRQHNPRVPRDLGIICQKCLQKDPARRYASAAALADDLDRFLAGEPIRARPVGGWECALKWARRRPAAAALAAVLLVSGLALLVGGWWYNARLQEEVYRANTQEKEARAARDSADGYNARLREEVDRANTQEKAARAARDGAEKTFRKRLATIDDMMLNLDGRLANMQGMDSVRIEFLGEFQRLANQLVNDRPKDRTARRQVGRVVARIGALYSRSKIYRESDEAFGHALAIQKALAREVPNQPQYQTDLALTHAQHARSLQSQGQHPLAVQSLQQAFAILDQLAAASPEQPTLRVDAEHHRFELANTLEDAGEPERARAAYTESLQALAKLVKGRPTPELHSLLAQVTDSLGALLADQQPAEALRLVQESLQHRRAAWQMAPHVTKYEANMRQAYGDTSYFLLSRGLHADLDRLASQVAADSPERWTDFYNYNAACFMGLATSAVVKTRPIPADAKQLLESYGSRAVKFLHKAAQAGYPANLDERQHMDQDPDLDELRDRADFKAHLAKLDQRFALKAPTPGQLVESLTREYRNDDANFRLVRTAARTVAQRKRALAKAPLLGKYAERFLHLAEKYRDQPAALEALTWVLLLTDPENPSRLAPELKEHRRRALTVLERDHLVRPDLTDVCLVLGQVADPAADRLLVAIEEKHPETKARGLAAYGLARSYWQQWIQCEQKEPQRAAALAKQAEQKLQTVLDRYANVAVNDTPLGGVCRKKLVELRHLSVGSRAQEIEGDDLKGVRFKLSDYKGKVVVLDFWANWCGYCRKEYEFNKAMVQGLEGKPFVLLGVNCDENKAEVQNVVDNRGLNWRSWFDGGTTGNRISQQWQVDSFPTVFVLDHNGVIRYKNLRGPQLEAAVLQLLRAQEAAAAGK